MNERLDDDRDLRQVLASTEVEPADEAFVAAVTSRLASRRRLAQAAYAAGVLGLGATVVFVLPHLLALSTAVAEFPVAHADTVAAGLSSPIGMALSAVTAVLVLVRALAPE